MLESNELRIGNWVDWVISKDTQSVYKKLFNIETGGQIDRMRKDFEPIPLTADWLLKLSFEKESPDAYSKTTVGNQYNLQVTVPQEGELATALIFNPTRNGQQKAAIHTLKYVHQLQNLYFGLTLEELSFNAAC